MGIPRTGTGAVESEDFPEKNLMRGKFTAAPFSRGATKSAETKAMMVPNIDYGLCQGCGGCAEAYPQFFEMRDDKAWVINADKFTTEHREGVLLICPYYAISVE
jgi:ferredoxin